MISTPASLRSDHWMPSPGSGGGQLESVVGFPGIRILLPQPFNRTFWALTLIQEVTLPVPCDQFNFLQKLLRV